MILVLVVTVLVFSALSGVWQVGWLLLTLFVLGTAIVLAGVWFGSRVEYYNLTVAVIFPALIAAVFGQVIRHAILALKSLWLHNRH